MNQELNKLKKLRDHIVGLEMKINLIETDLTAVESDLIFLEAMEQNLEENLKILKSNGIIAIASEYKKIKIEMRTVMKNLRFYRDIQEKLRRDLAKFEKQKIECLAEFDTLRADYEGRQVVIPFDASKRKK